MAEPYGKPGRSCHASQACSTALDRLLSGKGAPRLLARSVDSSASWSTESRLATRSCRKSSNAPDRRLSGINQTPTRVWYTPAWPTCPARGISSGSVKPTLSSRPRTARHRSCATSSASRTNPAARPVLAITAVSIPSSSGSLPPAGSSPAGSSPAGSSSESPGVLMSTGISSKSTPCLHSRCPIACRSSLPSTHRIEASG